jgi:hypothetical protein
LSFVQNVNKIRVQCFFRQVFGALRLFFRVVLFVSTLVQQLLEFALIAWFVEGNLESSLFVGVPGDSAG